MKEIPLTKGMAALVDDDVFDQLAKFNWTYFGRGYAARHVATSQVVGGKRRRKVEWMHRVIMNAPDGVDVDHIDGNRMDNRRENLRLATHKQNVANRRKQTAPCSSKWKGVTLHRNGWMAKCEYHFLGYFGTEDQAGLAYNLKAVELFGEFALLNDIPDGVTLPPERAYCSQYQGVTYHKGARKWVAKFTHKKTLHSLGLFASELDAARAYDLAVRQVKGPTAKTNFQ